jgi:putative ABC transport system permease protein
MLSEIRLAVRVLLKSPGYTLIALATLALGIGVNTSMFSVVDALVFRGAPYPDSDRLVILEGVTRSGRNRSFSDTEFREIQPVAEGFSSLTVFSRGGFTMTEPGRPPERVGSLSVSSGVLDTLRLQPPLGRTFTAEDFEQGKNQVIMLSHAFWMSRFGGDARVIGRTLRVDGDMVTVVGVMPPGAEYNLLWGNVGIWRPLNLTPDQMRIRAYRSFVLIGRLRDGVDPAVIGAQLAPLATTQEKDFPQDYPNLRYNALVLNGTVMDEVGEYLSWTLLGLSGFILLIACANLANLQLARATGSVREFAIRAALGASRRRLITQQFTESIVLSVVGGVLGIVVALWVNNLLERTITIDGVQSFALPINTSVFAITLAVSVLTGLLFGVAPALLASRTDVNAALKSQARGSTAGPGHGRVRKVLIIGEVALALVLLGGAAIMNRGFSRLLERDSGWDTDRVLTGTVPVSEIRYDSGEKRIELYRRVEEKLNSLPGVERAALATSVPVFGYSSDRQIFNDAMTAGAPDNPTASHAMIYGNYFETMGIKLREGSMFARDLKADGPKYVIVNESLARRLWPEESAVGKRLGLLDNSSDSNETLWREVIGVAADVEPAASITDPQTTLTAYLPLVQEPWSFFWIVVRGNHPETLVETVRRAVADVDPDLPVDGAGTVRQAVDRSMHNLVVVGYMIGGFAVLGLVLAAVGLYGVISHVVAQRTGEFGIRIAIGAMPRDILVDVLRSGIGLALVGLAIGVAGAFGLGRFLESFMPRLASPDPAAIIGVALVLFVVTLVACWFPARRATKVDPLTALRAE